VKLENDKYAIDQFAVAGGRPSFVNTTISITTRSNIRNNIIISYNP
jgi:hypothetical protein